MFLYTVDGEVRSSKGVTDQLFSNVTWNDEITEPLYCVTELYEDPGYVVCVCELLFLLLYHVCTCSFMHTFLSAYRQVLYVCCVVCECVRCVWRACVLPTSLVMR